MNRIFALLTLFLITAAPAFSQHAHCGFDEHLERMLEKDPAGMQVILEHNARTEAIKRARLNGESERAGGPRIIPTVFHVIHTGGSENISYEQIEDQMRILNEDFQRMNEDTVNLRPEFAAVAANPNVEFRLAKLDPMGNCTDGVVRVFSPLTENASDDNGVKGLSYWDRSKYLNVWVVKNIDNEGEPGTILGYAQFPGLGAAATDGLVVRSDRIGSIGTAIFNDKGRTLTHEAGHWFGLFHTFQGGCNGGFFGEPIDDTPPQAEATAFSCPQNQNSCSTDNPDLPDMVENYMDYSNGSCQNTYTLGQKDAMDAVLAGSRSNLYSSGNLDDTGVLLAETPCAPRAQFSTERRIVCAGQPITFNDGSFNGEVETYTWDLPGATPNTSGDASPTVVYDAAGVYSVTMNVSNAQGSDSETLTDYITVLPSEAAITSYFSFEGFEEQEEDYLVLSDNLGNTWEESTAAAYTDNTSIVINNFSGNPAGSVDEFQLPSVDLTQMNQPEVFFRLAYKERNNANDRLRVYVSDDCGESWSLRFNRSGSSLATVNGTQGSPYTPSSEADWELVDVNLGAFDDEDNVIVKFQCMSDGGNNIYIDDIQISGPLGVSDEATGFAFTISPNPLIGESMVNLEVKESANYTIQLTDVAGKTVANLHNGTLTAGKHQFEVSREWIPSAGVYFVQVETETGRSVQKLLVQ